MTVQIVTSDADKLTLEQHRIAAGLSRAELAQLAGIHPGTVAKAESLEYQFNTNIGSAYAMTKVLGIEICDVRWLRDVSHVGRPAGTGCPLTLVPEPPAAPICKTCFMELPATGICDDCS